MKFIENCFDMDVFIILLVIICFKFSGYWLKGTSRFYTVVESNP
jgi:hypothetical protein